MWIQGKRVVETTVNGVRDTKKLQPPIGPARYNLTSIGMLHERYISPKRFTRTADD